MDEDDGAARVKPTYGDNYPRLVAIKTKYDPYNMFHMSQNTVPSYNGSSDH